MTEEIIRPNPNHFRLVWASSEWGNDAARLRNTFARRYRKEGYEVKCGTTSFADLARDQASWLEAYKPGTTRSPFGAETHYFHMNTIVELEGR